MENTTHETFAKKIAKTMLLFINVSSVISKLQLDLVMCVWYFMSIWIRVHSCRCEKNCLLTDPFRIWHLPYFPQGIILHASAFSHYTFQRNAFRTFFFSIDAEVIKLESTFLSKRVTDELLLAASLQSEWLCKIPFR